MSGFAEPLPPSWKCSHCGRLTSWATSRGPVCGSTMCAKLDRVLDERDKLRAALKTACDRLSNYDDPSDLRAVLDEASRT